MAPASFAARLDALEARICPPLEVGGIVVKAAVSDEDAKMLWRQQNPGKPDPGLLIIVALFGGRCENLEEGNVV